MEAKSETLGSTSSYKSDELFEWGAELNEGQSSPRCLYSNAKPNKSPN